MTSLRKLIDNDKVELTDGVKKQVLKDLLPIATKGHESRVNGDLKDTAK